MTASAMGSLTRKSASVWLVVPCVRVRMRSPFRLIGKILQFLFAFLPCSSLPCRPRVCILSRPCRPSPPPPRPLFPHPFVRLFPPSFAWSAPHAPLRHPPLTVPHPSSPSMAFFFLVVFPKLYLHRTLLVSCGGGYVRHQCVGCSFQCVLDATIALWNRCLYSDLFGFFPPARPLRPSAPVPNTPGPRISGLVVVSLSPPACFHPPAQEPSPPPPPSLRPPTFSIPIVICPTWCVAMYILFPSHQCFVFVAQPSPYCAPPTCVFSIVVCTLVCVSYVSMKANILLGACCHLPISSKMHKRKTRASRPFSYYASPSTHYCTRVEGWHQRGSVERCRDGRGGGKEGRGYWGSESITVCVRPATGMGRAVGPLLQPSTARKNV